MVRAAGQVDGDAVTGGRHARSQRRAHERRERSTISTDQGKADQALLGGRQSTRKDAPQIARIVRQQQLGVGGGRGLLQHDLRQFPLDASRKRAYLSSGTDDPAAVAGRIDRCRRLSAHAPV